MYVLYVCMYVYSMSFNSHILQRMRLHPTPVTGCVSDTLADTLAPDWCQREGGGGACSKGELSDIKALQCHWP